MDVVLLIAGCDGVFLLGLCGIAVLRGDGGRLTFVAFAFVGFTFVAGLGRLSDRAGRYHYGDLTSRCIFDFVRAVRLDDARADRLSARHERDYAGRERRIVVINLASDGAFAATAR